MKTYTYTEVNNNIEKEFSRLVLEKLQSGSTIIYTYNNKDITFDDYEHVSAFDYGENIGVGKLEYVRLHRNGHYATLDDFNNIIKPLRKERAERKPNRSSYRVVNVAPESLIDRLKEFSGFKKVSKDNLKIMRSENSLLLNCGTNRVLEYKISRWTKTSLEESYMKKEQFNSIYESAKVR